jgi:glycosyltransferase involved in cell wall biosynthesis
VSVHEQQLSVAHLIHGLEMGGLEQLVLQLSVESQKRGIRSVIVALGEDGPMRALIERHGIELTLLEGIDGMSMPALMSIRRVLERSGEQVLHGHDLGPWLNAVAARALRPKTRVLATFHEQRRPEGRKRKAAQVAARFSDALVACGTQVRNEIRGWAPDSTNVPVIENGVALMRGMSREAARAELHIPDGAVAIAYVGSLREIKGPDKLVDAFLDRFRGDARVHLYLVGEGPLKAELRARAEGSRNVHFTGVLLDAARYLPGFDVYAQTSLSEGRSLSMLEAMAAGLPTLAHALTPIREIHADGETALLVPLGDRAGLGAALQRLADDPALRARLGAAARERARPHSIDAMVDAYEKLYRDVVARA